jgi:hypothetical protein
MSKKLFAAAVVAFSLTLPLSQAHAGFWTDVAKGAVKNSARHAKKTIKDAADLGRLVGSCAANRAAGRQC